MVYQNDLSYQVSNANLNMYADDHQLFTVGSNAYSMKARLQSEAAKALTWYNDNYLMVSHNGHLFSKHISEMCIKARRGGTPI